MARLDPLNTALRWGDPVVLHGTFPADASFSLIWNGGTLALAAEDRLAYGGEAQVALTLPALPPAHAAWFALRVVDASGSDVVPCTILPTPLRAMRIAGQAPYLLGSTLTLFAERGWFSGHEEIHCQALVQEVVVWSTRREPLLTRTVAVPTDWSALRIVFATPERIDVALPFFAPEALRGPVLAFTLAATNGERAVQCALEGGADAWSNGVRAFA